MLFRRFCVGLIAWFVGFGSFVLSFGDELHELLTQLSSIRIISLEAVEEIEGIILTSQLFVRVGMIPPTDERVRVTFTSVEPVLALDSGRPITSVDLIQQVDNSVGL